MPTKRIKITFEGPQCCRDLGPWSFIEPENARGFK